MEALVSIITPTFNSANFIAETIKSVQNQSYSNWEMILIDDGSIDNTEEIILSLIENDTRILVLSGPNAGGKSVCMKAIGLIQLMVQSGMLIPAKEGAEIGVFDKIFADIGDQQSLEDELSTLKEVAESIFHNEISLGIGVDWLEAETGRKMSRPGLKKYVDKVYGRFGK